jgi:CDP-diacylglycerol--glycerol-3-phosphate 3-phosphatidyltransferase
MSELNPAIEQYRGKNDWFTPSNMISVMRAMMAVPAVIAIVGHWYLLVASICIAAFISDLLDGLIARKTDSVSEMGKVIDPLADKIYVGCVVIAMAAYSLIPLWFLAIILCRDLIIVIGGIWAKRKLGVVLPSNYPGKIAVLTISISIFMVFVGVPANVISTVEYVSVALMAISLGVYGQRLVSLLKVK